MAVEDSVAQDQLRAFIERIERMEEEKAAISADIKEIYAEAKGNGFDTKILRKIVTIRKQDANERAEQNAILELYMGALGMVAAPSEDDDYQPPARRGADISAVDPELLQAFIEGSKTEAGRKLIKGALDAANGPVGRAQAMVESEAASGIEWVRGHAVEPERHAYSKAFAKLGQDPHVIQGDIEGARAAPIIMIGDEILDGWARYNSARCNIGLDGQSAFYPVVQYVGADPLIDCIKWNVAGRMMSEADRLNVAAALTKLEPKRKRDIFGAFDLGMELVA